MKQAVVTSHLSRSRTGSSAFVALFLSSMTRRCVSEQQSRWDAVHAPLHLLHQHLRPSVCQPSCRPSRFTFICLYLSAACCFNPSFFVCLPLWVFTLPSPKRRLSLFSTLSRPTWKWPARFKRRLNKFSVVCWHFKYQASAEPSLPCPSGGNLRCGSFTSHAWCMAAYLFAALLPVMSYISLPHDLSLPEVMSAVGDTTRLFLGENNEQLC